MSQLKLPHGSGGRRVRHHGNNRRMEKHHNGRRYRITKVLKAALVCAQNHLKPFSPILSVMKLYSGSVSSASHLQNLVCMATLFVWYNGKVLHTWHYNRLVTHAGVCFLNNNPRPARALRNVITVNLTGADHPGDKCASLVNRTPIPTLPPTERHSRMSLDWNLRYVCANDWIPHSSVLVLHTLLVQLL